MHSSSWLSLVFLFHILFLLSRYVLYPTVKHIRRQRLRFDTYVSERKIKLKHKQEALINLAVAKAKGDLFISYEKELCDISYELNILDKNYPEIICKAIQIDLL